MPQIGSEGQLLPYIAGTGFSSLEGKPATLIGASGEALTDPPSEDGGEQKKRPREPCFGRRAPEASEVIMAIVAYRDRSVDPQIRGCQPRATTDPDRVACHAARFLRLLDPDERPIAEGFFLRAAEVCVSHHRPVCAEKTLEIARDAIAFLTAAARGHQQAILHRMAGACALDARGARALAEQALCEARGRGRRS